MKKYKKTDGKIIIPYGVYPERHELRAASILAAYYGTVEFIRAKNIFKHKNPDIKMGGIIWEIKVPIGKSKRTIENNYRVAQQQSENVIFDIRNIGIGENQAIAQIKREASIRRARKLRRIKIITKSSKILDIDC